MRLPSIVAAGVLVFSLSGCSPDAALLRGTVISVDRHRLCAQQRAGKAADRFDFCGPIYRGHTFPPQLRPGDCVDAYLFNSSAVGKHLHGVVLAPGERLWKSARRGHNCD
jgi:hypothetical protein